MRLFGVTRRVFFGTFFRRFRNDDGGSAAESGDLSFELSDAGFLSISLDDFCKCGACYL